ncbi:hypothetical protein IX51_04795 [uncultured archaeon]|nr:hypothetical protein IX51_04795 [uncultured archaeon]
MSVGATILASFLVLIELALLFSRPSFGFAGHTYYVSQGVAAFAMLIGALFWAIAEMFTPAGRTFWALASRFIVAFLIGGIFGGIVGSVSDFGQLVLVPASNGNGLAIFMLLGYLWVFIVLVYSGAWMHAKNFVKRGGKQ